MIRCFSSNLQKVADYAKLLHQPVSATVILQRFQFTENFGNVRKIAEEKDQELEKIKKYRNAEVHLWYGCGYKCINPELMTEEQWKHLYGLDAKHQRQRYLRHLLFLVESKAKWKEVVAEERKAKIGTKERIQTERKTNQHIVYGLGHNSLMLRITKQTINKWYNRKLVRARLYGQKIVVDCSYEDYMTDVEHSKVVKGLARLYSENRKHVRPLDLHICGVKSESAIIKKLSERMPSLLTKGSFTGVHTESVTELFPKDRLVILTPDSDNIIKYKSDDIYVMGGIVDLGRNDPLTLAKAKRLKIRHARLPLDNLKMGPGDRKLLPFSSAAAVIREFQINNNVGEVVEKCVYLRSKCIEKYKK